MTKQNKTFSVAKTSTDDVSRIESWIKEESMQISIHHDYGDEDFTIVPYRSVAAA